VRPGAHLSQADRQTREGRDQQYENTHTSTQGAQRASAYVPEEGMCRSRYAREARAFQGHHVPFHLVPWASVRRAERWPQASTPVDTSTLTNDACVCVRVLYMCVAYVCMCVCCICVCVCESLRQDCQTDSAVQCVCCGASITNVAHSLLVRLATFDRVWCASVVLWNYLDPATSPVCEATSEALRMWCARCSRTCLFFFTFSSSYSEGVCWQARSASALARSGSSQYLSAR
jgi:hypothetical protein